MFTSIDAAWQYIQIPRQDIERAVVRESLYQGADLLLRDFSINLTRCHQIVKVENYMASLPIGAMRIEAIARILDTQTEITIDEYGDMCSLLDYDDDDSNDEGNDPSTWIPNYDVVNGKVQQLLTSHHHVYYDSLIYQNRFQIIEASNDPFTRGLFCEYSPNLNAECSDNFSVTPEKNITFSFDDDYVSVAYFSLPVDRNNSLIIPDDPNFIRAVAAYATWKHWEARANSLEQGAERREAKYQIHFENLSNKWRAISQSKSLNFNALKQINQRYFHLIQSPVVWNFPYDKMYG